MISIQQSNAVSYRTSSGRCHSLLNLTVKKRGQFKQYLQAVNIFVKQSIEIKSVCNCAFKHINLQTNVSKHGIVMVSNLIARHVAPHFGKLACIAHCTHCKAHNCKAHIWANRRAVKSHHKCPAQLPILSAANVSLFSRQLLMSE